MAYYTKMSLDDKVKQEIEAIPNEELTSKKAYALYNFIRYGVQAIGQLHIFRQAKATIEGKVPLEEFCRRYQIADDHHDGLTASPNAVEQDGIYIPSKIHLNGYGKPIEKRILILNSDFNNVFIPSYFEEKSGKEAVDFLHKFTATEKDRIKLLGDKKFVEKGITFSRKMWDESVKKFEKYANGIDDVAAQPKKLTELGRQLIAYYQQIVEGK